MTSSSEADKIVRLASAFARADPRVLLGIGDDAAVIASPEEPLVWTIDACVDGVHFRRDLLDLADLGYRATMAAASDLAAMGATPLALLSALVLPSDFSDADLDLLALGQADAARELGASIVGGNLARGCELSITTTALGHASHPLGRAGAKFGDRIAIAGPLGLAAAGLVALNRKLGADPELAEAIAAFRRPRAHIAEGLRARDVADAAIDVSDGLALDLAHVARASGVGISLEPSALTSPSLDAAARVLNLDPLELALHGGDDYALVVALPPGVDLLGFRLIGSVVEQPEPMVSLNATDGSSHAVEPRGFDHFARR